MIRNGIHWHGGRAAIGLTQQAHEDVVFLSARIVAYGIAAAVTIVVYRQELLAVVRWAVST